MRHLDIFSGIGGFALAAQEVWGDEYECVGFCDNDYFCQQVLTKNFPGVPIYGDIRELTAARLTTDAHGAQQQEQQERHREGGSTAPEPRHSVRAGAGIGDQCRSTSEGMSGLERGAGKLQIDLLTGGFPCQPFSNAGKKRGNQDDRYLWPEMLRVIRETKPTWVIGENVAGIINMALEQVCVDLENEGYAVQPFVIPAAAVGAPHRRDRVWIVGHATRYGCDGTENTKGRTQGSNSDETWAHELRQPQRADSVWEGVAEDDRNTDSKRELQSKGFEQNIRGRLSDASGNAPDAAVGGRRQGNQDAGGDAAGNGAVGTKERCRPANRRRWDADWREIALATCHDGVDARVSQWLDLFLGRLEYASSYEKISDKELQTLLKAVSSTKVQWPTGGRHEIPTQTFLLRALRWIQGRREVAGWLFQRGSAEVSEKELREMRNEIESARSSQGRETVEQRAKKLADALPFLPLQIALEITQSWDGVRVLQERFPRTALIALPDGSTISEARWRREALKAYGNAIVPQVAVEIMEAIKAQSCSTTEKG